jgi:outer membrane immunogenic protein
MHSNYFISKSAFLCFLLSSVALPVLPAHADAELDALQARLEKAQKENLRLKAEKLEKENLSMKAETLENENTKLRAEARATPNANPSSTVGGSARPQSKIAEGNSAPRHMASYAPASIASRSSRADSDRAVRRALENIPKNDPRREMTAAAHLVPVSTLPPVVQQWSGVYVGINAGYGTGEVNSWANGYTIGGQPFSQENGQLGFGAGESTSQYNGPVVGGQFGYNHEFVNHVVVGAEADMAYTDINNRYSNSNNPTRNYSISSTNAAFSSNSSRDGIDWMGTVRARLGYSLGSLLPYISGGFAYGGLSSTNLINSMSLMSFSNGGSTYGSNYSTIGGGFNNNISVGWAAGAGAEYKAAENWSLRGEYLFTNLNGLSTNGLITIRSSSTGANYNSTSTAFYTGAIGPFGIHQVRFGLNYHTGWGASVPAIAAKY